MTTCNNCDHRQLECDDENLLLDDENISSTTKNCSRCNQEMQPWSNSSLSNNPFNNSILTISGVNPSPSLEDHEGDPEDSPLIRDSSSSQGLAFHCHTPLKNTNDQKAWKRLMLASLLCFFFMIAEVIGGYLAGSLAIMTDAAHLFSDFIGFLISLLSIYIARKSPTKSMTFGYHRAEVLGAFLSVLTVWLLAAVFAVLAINRLMRKDYHLDADTMLLVASMGLVVNIVMGAVLFGFCHNHSHGLSSSTECDTNSNINVRAAAAHVLGDLLQSVGVLIAAILIKAFPSALIIDPICTLIFSVVVLVATANVAKDSLSFLMEGSPKNSNKLALQLQSLGNVRHLHDLHIWTLSPGKDAVSVHLCVDKFCDRDVLLHKATSLIKSTLNVISCTVQIEVYNPEVVSTCGHCRPLY